MKIDLRVDNEGGSVSFNVCGRGILSFLPIHR